MKKITSKMVMASLLAFAFISLISFNRAPGGDSFQVYLNGKLVLDKAMYKYKSIENLEFAQASVNDKIEICYSHCGQTGTSRSITAKDDKEKILKIWRFADTDGRKMSMRLQDLKDLQTNNKKNSIGLYYSSKEIVKEQELVSLSIGNKSLATR